MAFVPFTKDDQPTMQAFNEKFQQIYGEASGKARIVAGSYTGTGTYGDTTPNTLTFSIAPRVVLINQTSEKGSSYGAYFVLNGNGSVVWGTSGIQQCTWSGNKISWYSNGAGYQLNNSGKVYRYVAIGI